MDAVLHGQRIAERPPLGAAEIAVLPDGAMIAVGGQAYAVRHGNILPWRFSGYGAPRPLPRQPARLLTPPASVAALGAGYRPLWHPSAS